MKKSSLSVKKFVLPENLQLPKEDQLIIHRFISYYNKFSTKIIYDIARIKVFLKTKTRYF
jgi:hypothetical protein